MSEISSPTIYDVARAAGVARATVDRVIYNRGGVSPKTVEKVRKVIDDLGYVANPNASRLASKRNFTIAILIPEFKAGDYWSVAYDGFIEGAKSIKTYDIRTDIYLFDQNNVNSFIEQSEKIIASQPSGVITNVVFADAVKDFATRLDVAKIPYAFVDQKIDGLNYAVYFGTDPYEAGRLGAYLLTHRMEVRDIALVRLIRDSRQKADPNKPKRDGFIDYVQEYYPECRIHSVFIHPGDPEETYSILDAFFRSHPDVKFVVMANSRVHLLGNYLKANPDPERHVVGFDDLEANIELVKEGLVEYLVTRNIPMQSYNTISYLSRSVISQRAPAQRDNYMHNDILAKMNCKDYEFKV